MGRLSKCAESNGYFELMHTCVCEVDIIAASSPNPLWNAWIARKTTEPCLRTHDREWAIKDVTKVGVVGPTSGQCFETLDVKISHSSVSLVNISIYEIFFSTVSGYKSGKYAYAMEP